MNVRIVSNSPRKHRQFHRDPQLEPGCVEARVKHHFDRHFHRTQRMNQGHRIWALVGQIHGFAESLSDLPLEAQVEVVVGTGTYSLEGTIVLYNPDERAGALSALESLEATAYILANSDDMKNVEFRLSYQQHITELATC